MNILGLHHVAVAVSDMARAEAFYVDVLGLRPCPAKPNWLSAGHGFEVHLMPSRSGQVPADPARHFTLEVERLDHATAHLLAHGLRPYQVTVDQLQRHEIVAPDDALDFGIGTVFVDDPDGNTVEFLQADRGITARILGAEQAVVASTDRASADPPARRGGGRPEGRDGGGLPGRVDPTPVRAYGATRPSPSGEGSAAAIPKSDNLLATSSHQQTCPSP